MVNGQQSTVNGQLKILILTHRFCPEVGGIETNSEILASAFHEFGADVHVITWTKNNEPDNFPFTVIRSPHLNLLLQEHKWANVILENNPCLRLSWPNIFIRRPLVIAVNTWVNRINGNKTIRDKLKQLWFRRAKNVIAVSNAVRKKEWKQAVVIENPYNDRLFKIIPGIQKNIPFVFLGRLVSDKGADQAIKAIAALVDEKKLNKEQVQLTVIGDGPERQNLVALIKKYALENAVELTGILKGKALVECLNRHRFILVPSYWEEPYGNVVLEGMACGCVPVASNGGGLPEAVGNAGFIFQRNNINALTDILRKIVCDDEQANTARQNAAAHLAKHAVELVSKKYFVILKDAVTHR